jgi:hypothetical protein
VCFTPGKTPSGNGYEISFLSNAPLFPNKYGFFEDTYNTSLNMSMEYRWNDTERANPTYSEKKACPSATLSTTDITTSRRESNPGLHGGKPAISRLSHGAASTHCAGDGMVPTVFLRLLKTVSVETTNKMQPCNRIYYSKIY